MAVRVSAAAPAKSKIVKLRLPATLLARLITGGNLAASALSSSSSLSTASSSSPPPPDTLTNTPTKPLKTTPATTPSATSAPANAQDPPRSKSSSSSTGSNTVTNSSATAKADSAGADTIAAGPDDVSAADANTPVPPSADSDTPTKRKGIPGPKPGSKRGLSLGNDGLPKARGKPGPKKKIRVDGELVDAAGNRVPASSLPLPHKLGPKANQGAINAGLRALDRSGVPCRRWERKGFQLKSFTGVNWTVPTWRAPKKPAVVRFPGDVKSDSSAGAPSSDAKQANGHSGVASEQSNNGVDVAPAGQDTIMAENSAVPEVSVIAVSG